MPQTITATSTIAVYALDLSIVADEMHRALRLMVAGDPAARGALMSAIDRIARVHPHARGLGRYETIPIDDIDSGDMPDRLRDLVNQTARVSGWYIQAGNKDDWDLCHIAMEEVAKSAVDLMAYAERRAR
jgi:hypothetical protein